jgi:hypothetical protein
MDMLVCWFSLSIFNLLRKCNRAMQGLLRTSNIEILSVNIVPTEIRISNISISCAASRLVLGWTMIECVVRNLFNLPLNLLIVLFCFFLQPCCFNERLVLIHALPYLSRLIHELLLLFAYLYSVWTHRPHLFLAWLRGGWLPSSIILHNYTLLLSHVASLPSIGVSLCPYPLAWRGSFPLI